MIHTGYNPALVALSIALAVFAAYTALDLGSRVRNAAGRARFGWIGGAALAMGGGISSMHFVGMLAFEMGMPAAYDPDLTLLSLLAAAGGVAADNPDPGIPAVIDMGGERRDLPSRRPLPANARFRARIDDTAVVNVSVPRKSDNPALGIVGRRLTERAGPAQNCRAGRVVAVRRFSSRRGARRRR